MALEGYRGPKMSRGTAIRGLLGLGTVVSAIAETRREAKLVASGFETEHAVFAPPLLEDHNVGIDSSRVAPDLDFLFRESGTHKLADFLSAPSALVTEYMDDAGLVRMLPDDVLTKLAKRGTKLLFGDPYTPDMPGLHSSIENPDTSTTSTYENIEGVIGLATGAATLSGYAVGLRRRNLLAAGAGASLYAASNFIVGGLNGALVLTTDERKKSAMHNVERAWSAMQSATHPQDTYSFFRSLMMAYHMLSVAEKESKARGGEKVRMQYWIGQGHTVVQDFLLLGKDACAQIINRYFAAAPGLKEQMIELNGSLDAIFTAVTYELPKNFISADKLSDSQLRVNTIPEQIPS